MLCSVIILNWNGESMLRQFLPSVIKNTTGTDTEIVVADNGSTDNSLAVLKEFPTVRVLTFDRNYGFAEGYNRALKETEARYVVLLNSDVEVTEGWLESLLAFMEEHEDYAACQPKILSYKQKTHFEHAGAAGGYIDRYGYPYCRGRILNNTEEDKGQYDTVADVFWASGACMLVRRETYESCGGLDAAFFAHMEEIDLCWRMNCRGWRLACVPKSVVYHVGGGALDYSNPRKTYLNFRNNLLMLYKNLPPRRLPWVLLMRFLLDYTAMLQSLLTGKPGNAKAVIRAREYKAKRAENLRLATTLYPATMSRRSIIFDHYVFGL